MVSVTIWRLYDVMIARMHTNACYVFFYLHVNSIRLNELPWRSSRSINFQTLEFQSSMLGASTRRKPTMFECCFLISRYHENCNAMSFLVVIEYLSLRQGILVLAMQLNVFISSLLFLFIVYIFFKKILTYSCFRLGG